MNLSKPALPIGGRLAIDFANTRLTHPDISWLEFITFLVDTKTISGERAAALIQLERSDSPAVHAAHWKIQRLREALRLIFHAVAHQQKISRNWVEPINEVLRITEGHDELVPQEGKWHLQFVARESGLEWLLAAIARSAAEILVEGNEAPVRLCANPNCGLLFYDDSRTGKRRWCSMAVCGNRHKVAEFQKRHAASA